MKGKWKQVEGYEGLYEISNFRRVKGIKLHMAINGNMQVKNRIRRL